MDIVLNETYNCVCVYESICIFNVLLNLRIIIKKKPTTLSIKAGVDLNCTTIKFGHWVFHNSLRTKTYCICISLTVHSHRFNTKTFACFHHLTTIRSENIKNKIKIIKPDEMSVCTYHLEH